MNQTAFRSSPTGRLIRTLEGHHAFVPNKLPPGIELSWQLVSYISEADRRLSELSGAASKLPNPHLLIMPFTRKEAVLSSKIEGTVASLSDLLSFEAGGLFPEQSKKSPDVREVANYVDAMNLGLTKLKQYPVTLRLIRELHQQLMKGVRGENKMPGEFRDRQNWLGPPETRIEEATYVPPPVNEMGPLLDDLEKYIHAEDDLPPLVRMGIVHYQFEAIHPFLDGNGRIGRLLVTLLMVAQGLLSQPLLYLSAYFERTRAQYYDQLLRVSEKGEWDAWLRYFLRGISHQAKDALDRLNNLLTLNQSYRDKLTRKRASSHLLRLLDLLFSRPIITAGGATKELGVTVKSTQQHIDRLIGEGILKEITGQQRNRIYMAPEIMQILDI